MIRWLSFRFQRWVRERQWRKEGERAARMARRSSCVAVVLCLVVLSVADARGRRYRRGCYGPSCQPAARAVEQPQPAAVAVEVKKGIVLVDGPDLDPKWKESKAQKLCRLRAHHMAKHNYRGHCLQQYGYGEGRMEGCGWCGYNGTPGTCVGSGKILGDAIARANGMAYRVRIYESGGGRSYGRRRRWR